MDILMHVQFLVSNHIELALASFDRQALNEFTVETNREHSASSECILVSPKCKPVEQSHTSDSLTVKPVALRLRRQSQPSKNETISFQSIASSARCPFSGYLFIISIVFNLAHNPEHPPISIYTKNSS
ncbi:unnamed protein product [Echinostoma caproni]|uniref:Uncharacterized protein n=1 Tax=Echinostoma caproni TaxID=27848 RepID=A0A3P8LAR5_9TREM|nr:unnamed protein product [Echinostoma caproni]